MNYEQYEEIVREVLWPRWPKIKAEWSATYNRNVMYQRIKGYPADVVRRAAVLLSQESNYVPKAGVWDKACKGARAEDHSVPIRPVRVPCPDCGTTGFLLFGFIREGCGLGMVDHMGTLYHWMDIQPHTANRCFATRCVPCGCENTSRRYPSADPALVERARKAIRAFEAKLRPGLWRESHVEHEDAGGGDVGPVSVPRQAQGAGAEGDRLGRSLAGVPVSHHGSNRRTDGGDQEPPNRRDADLTRLPPDGAPDRPQDGRPARPSRPRPTAFVGDGTNVDVDVPF